MSVPETENVPSTVAVVSLGCVKNIIDTEVFLGRLAQNGFIPGADPREADFILVNTCSFIEPAMEESLDALRRLSARHPRVVAVGCMVQRLGEEIFDLVPALAGAVGLDEEAQLAQILRKLERSCDLFSHRGPARAPALADKARLRITPPHYAYLRVSEGCSAGCTFCIIPRIRGRLRSKPPGRILSEARELVRSGARELILVAQDLTAYGRDLPSRPRLVDLLEKLEKIPDLFWIRLLYLHPAKVATELVDRIARSEKILPCMDLPFQHVSTPVLKRMGRPMTTRSAWKLVRDLRSTIPPAVLRGTFMVGFPGETEEDFERLLRFVKKVGFPRGGVFKWSRQEGTRAAALGGRVPARTAAARRKRLHALLAENARRFNEERLGRPLTVVVDDEEDGFMLARSFAEAPDVDPVILLPAGSARAGEFLEVKPVRTRGLDLVAEPL